MANIYQLASILIKYAQNIKCRKNSKKFKIKFSFLSTLMYV